MWDKVNLGRKEMLTIHKIAKRFCELSESVGRSVDLLDLSMDLTACHFKNPLDLEGLLFSRDGDFLHDVLGIRRHLNRTTFELEDCFVPRYSAAVAA